MHWLVPYMAGAVITALLTGIIAEISIIDDRAVCRAANPGYECVRGFVRGEAFQ